MDRDRIDLVLKYALSIAARQDYGERELGAIHLIKYVYLGDLAFAQVNEGRTFTGAPWRFYHFGPWAAGVYERIAPVVAELGASERRFTSAKYEQDAIRWSLRDTEIAAEIERSLPFAVYRAVRVAVREFGSDTAGLLDFVYRTRPMVEAAPDEMLGFGPWSENEPERGGDIVADATPETLKPTRKAEKRRRHALRQAQESIRRRLREARESPPPTEQEPPPRHDEIFFAGQRWLDNLSEALEPQEGEVAFDREIWKSQARKDSGVPR